MDVCSEVLWEILVVQAVRFFFFFNWDFEFAW